MSMTVYPNRQELAPQDRMPSVRANEREFTPMLAPAPVPAPDLDDYAHLFLRHKRLLVWAAVAGCLLGLGFTLLQRPSYRAKSTLEVQNINSDFLNMRQARPVSDDAQGMDALMDMQTQIEVLRSTSLAAAAKLAVKQQWEAQAGSKGGVLPQSDAVLDKIADRLKVKEVGQTRLLQVEVEAPNPKLAADFANALVSEYIQQNIRSRSQMTEAAEDATRAQVVDMRHKVEASEDALQRYASSNGLVFTSDRQTISDEGLRQAQTDLLRARADLVTKQARRSLAADAKADSLADVEKDPDLRELRAKLTDLRRQQAELLTVFKPNYSEVLKVKAQADEVEASLAQSRARIVNRTLDEYAESSQVEKSLNEAYQQALSKAALDSQIAVHYDVLKREADANITAYQDMLSKAKELALATAFRTSNIRIVDPAEAPKRPSSPIPALNAALGLFSSLMLAVGYIFVADRSNKSLHQPGEASLRLGVPELAVIPRVEEGFPAKFALRAPSADDETSTLNVIRTSDNEATERVSDAFRTLLTSILFSTASHESPKVVVITSVAPLEGKTTVAANLGIALARTGKRVLLIDGDLRRPNLHDRFSLPNVIGFGNLLQAGCDDTDAQFAILPTSITRLHVLPAGSFTAAPADLLFQQNLQTVLRSYREHFDMIVIDSPPIMGLPDARLLGRVADGVVLVARANKTPRTAILTACDRILRDRSRVLGLVLNDWNGQNSAYTA